MRKGLFLCQFLAKLLQHLFSSWLVERGVAFNLKIYQIFLPETSPEYYFTRQEKSVKISLDF